MKKALLVLLAILLLIGIVVGIYFILHKTAPASQGQTGTAGTVLPGSGTASGVPQLAVESKDGTTLQTLDFIHNGVSFEDPANKGDYYLAGTNGLCNPDGSCPKAGDETDYTIIYFGESHSFVIGLNTEPLGTVRLEAEQTLMKTLGLTQTQMCNLQYTLGTTVYVNPAFGGENLGFSFCPGATKLP